MSTMRVDSNSVLFEIWILNSWTSLCWVDNTKKKKKYVWIFIKLCYLHWWKHFKHFLCKKLMFFFTCEALKLGNCCLNWWRGTDLMVSSNFRHHDSLVRASFWCHENQRQSHHGFSGYTTLQFHNHSGGWTPVERDELNKPLTSYFVVKCSCVKG